MESSIIDILSGAFAGVCFRLFGHPFEYIFYSILSTIKVRM
jgi:hypothetical protein